MRKSTKAISLVLMGTAASLLGYEAITPSHPRPPLSAGTNFDEDVERDDATTQPSSGASHSHSSPYYHHSSFSGGSSSSFSSGSHTASGAHSGTSRGGFGGTGHSASS